MWELQTHEEEEGEQDGTKSCIFAATSPTRWAFLMKRKAIDTPLMYASYELQPRFKLQVVLSDHPT